MNYTLLREGLWRSRWVVRGTDGGVVFLIRSAATFGVDYVLSDAGGTALGRIRNAGSWLWRIYEITIQGRVAAQVQSDGRWFGWGFVVELPGREPLAAEKPWMSRDFAFQRGGAEVAVAPRIGGLFGRTYNVWLRDDEPQLALLASLVAMDDYIMYRQSSGS